MELLTRLECLRDELNSSGRKRSRLVIAGHSLGATVVHTALAGVLKRRLAEAPYGPAPAHHDVRDGRADGPGPGARGPGRCRRGADRPLAGRRDVRARTGARSDPAFLGEAHPARQPDPGHPRGAGGPPRAPRLLHPPGRLPAPAAARRSDRAGAGPRAGVPTPLRVDDSTSSRARDSEPSTGPSAAPPHRPRETAC